ncbi:MAG: ISNCY family transposase, partial [Chloroflexota bacterium]|nr:ISNCY family transposase [Chloroflexota bacterium]
MSTKEQRRLMVLGGVDRGEVTASEAAQVLNLRVRQVRRLLAAYRRKGACALAHGNRGRRPGNALDVTVTQRVVELSRTKYAGFNNCHLAEFLAEREGMTLSISSVRRIRLGSGTASPRRRRAPKHRSRRERYPRAGMLLQADGSHHDWLEGRGPYLTLTGAIDDATGEVVAALFRYQEDSHGYLLLLRDIVSTHGIPGAVYHDRHSIFEVPTTRRESIEEQLAGKRDLTQVGRAMEELGITSIPSLSPQARGRIERLWKTFQDRLVSEL